MPSNVGTQLQGGISSTVFGSFVTCYGPALTLIAAGFLIAVLFLTIL